jgi:hypothetical protein
MDATLTVAMAGNAEGSVGPDIEQGERRERAELEVEMARQSLIQAYQNLDSLTGGSNAAFEAWSVWEADQLAHELAQARACGLLV